MTLRAAAAFAALSTVGLFGEAMAEPVNFITDFGFNGRHAYFYVALDKGYYEEEGLDVTILRGQGSADAIRNVASGSADIGFADAGSLVLARGNDGVPVKLVSIVYASPPQALFALSDSGMSEPADLEGKVIADTASSSNRLLFPAYAQAAGIDASTVTWVAAESSALPTLLATGRVDAIGQFLVGEPLLAAATAPSGVEAFPFRDVLSFYGNGIVASEETIAENPDMVRGFVRATIRGMEDAFAAPQEAGAIMNRYQRQIDPDVIAGETELVATLAQVEGQPLGLIDPSRVQETVDVVMEYFTIDRPVEASELFVEGFVE